MAKSKSNFRTQKFSGSHMLLVALTFAIVGGLTTWATFAAAPNKNSGNGTISLQMVTDKNGDGLPNYGDVVTFKWSTTSTTDPFVYLACNQNGTLVFQQWLRMDLPSPNFTLGGTTAWTGGAADCTAYLQNWDSYSKNGKITNITSTTFHVNA